MLQTWHATCWPEGQYNISQLLAGFCKWDCLHQRFTHMIHGMSICKGKENYIEIHKFIALYHEKHMVWKRCHILNAKTISHLFDIVYGWEASLVLLNSLYPKHFSSCQKKDLMIWKQNLKTLRNSQKLLCRATRIWKIGNQYWIEKEKCSQ